MDEFIVLNEQIKVYHVKIENIKITNKNHSQKKIRRTTSLSRDDKKKKMIHKTLNAN